MRDNNVLERNKYLLTNIKIEDEQLNAETYLKNKKKHVLKYIYEIGLNRALKYPFLSLILKLNSYLLLNKLLSITVTYLNQKV